MKVLVGVFLFILTFMSFGQRHNKFLNLPHYDDTRVDKNVKKKTAHNEIEHMKG